MLKIYNLFYIVHNGKKVKKIPLDINSYLTPRALAFWIMDDGSKVDKGGMLLHSNSYSYE